MTTTTEILARIQDRSALVGIIGQGYVGLPLALVFEEAGFRVRGFDVDPAKVDALSKGHSYIRHIGSDRVREAVGRGRFTATTDFDQLAECDAILICVPTPLGPHREAPAAPTAGASFITEDGTTTRPDAYLRRRPDRRICA